MTSLMSQVSRIYPDPSKKKYYSNGNGNIDQYGPVFLFPSKQTQDPCIKDCDLEEKETRGKFNVSCCKGDEKIVEYPKESGYPESGQVKYHNQSLGRLKFIASRYLATPLIRLIDGTADDRGDHGYSDPDKYTCPVSYNLIHKIRRRGFVMYMACVIASGIPFFLGLGIWTFVVLDTGLSLFLGVILATNWILKGGN